MGRDTLTTAGLDTVLRAVPEEAATAPGHLAFIRLQFTDKNGIVKPTERGLIDVQVEGGTLVGLGSACPFYELSYLGTRCDTYYGEALAIVRAGEEKKITFTATDGIHDAKVSIPIQQKR